MKLGFIALALVIAPLAAQAELDVHTCSSRNGATEFAVAFDFQGTYEDAAGAVGGIPAKAVVRFVKLNGRQDLTGESQQLTGSIANSAKGPYLDLSGKNVKLFISAPASKSPSELTVSGKNIEVDCD